ATQAGVILGTAAYMAPEQSQGQPVDQRADVWAFGVVLYEMLTGSRLFEGQTSADTLAAVLKDEPNWDRVSSKVRPLLRWCLEKDPKRRLRDIASAMRIVELTADTPPPAPGWRHWLAWSASGPFLLLAIVVASIYFRENAPVAEPVRFQI